VGVPDYETLMRTTLAALKNGQPQTRGQIRDAVAAATHIRDDDLAEMLPSGKATVAQSATAARDGLRGREALLSHTGKPGDGGLDGISRPGRSRPRSGRCSGEEVRPRIREGAQTSRGVFVTTGRFSSGARQFAEQVARRLVLIDGTELTRLMVGYNVGVAVREIYELKAVDDDFFEDDE
jgi:restriction endonuclease Mrr